MKIAEKQNIVENLHERFARSKMVIVTDYKGLDVTTINDLRRKLRESQIEYQVVKNSLLIRAAEKTEVELIKENFKGPSAVAISFDDPVAPAKVLTQFAKEYEKLEIKAGVMGDKVLDVDNIKTIAKLPSREELLAQLLSAMNGVAAGFVRVLNGVPQNLMNVLAAVKDKKEAA